jgi:aminoglycoside 6'-N-acetyltransferase I
MKIRPIEAADFDEWLRLRLALWPDHTADEHRAEMQQIAGESLSPVFVADRGNGRLSGFLEAGLRKYADGCDTSPVGYIEGWYVDVDVRQQGLGRALMQAAEQWAITHGCTEIASDCLIDNEVSYRAHLAIGYLETERLIHFKKDLRRR